MRLIAFGDSMVAGVGDPDHLGWIGRALVGHRDVTLYNLGVRRETSRDIAARWRAEAAPRLVDYEPMRIVFSFGVNDCFPVHEGGQGQRLSTAQTLTIAEPLLSAARALAPVLQVGPPPVTDPGVNARVEALNEVLKGLADGLGVPYIDVFQPLMAGGVWRAEALAWDGAHPGAAGYDQMAELVAAHPAWQAFVAR